MASKHLENAKITVFLVILFVTPLGVQSLCLLALGKRAARELRAPSSLATRFGCQSGSQNANRVHKLRRAPWLNMMQVRGWSCAARTLGGALSTSNLVHMANRVHCVILIYQTFCGRADLITNTTLLHMLAAKFLPVINIHHLPLSPHSFWESPLFQTPVG